MFSNEAQLLPGTYSGMVELTSELFIFAFGLCCGDTLTMDLHGACFTIASMELHSDGDRLRLASLFGVRRDEDALASIDRSMLLCCSLRPDQIGLHICIGRFAYKAGVERLGNF